MRVLLLFSLLAMAGSRAETAAPPPLTGDDYVRHWQQQAETLLKAWNAPGASRGAQERDALVTAAVQAEAPAIVEEVALGAAPATLEIPLPAKAKAVPARVLFRFPKFPEAKDGGDRLELVIRRITEERFEVWTPTQGWLFDGEGDLRNRVKVPRRDGTGREWFGAFLPDGRSVTTDLWAMDKTLTFFSRTGQWLREIPTDTLAPPKPDSDVIGLIGWARGDRTGRFWVVSIGSDWGRAVVKVSPDGTFRVLTDKLADSPWQLCYPRDLEPKGTYTSLSRPSDDGQTVIEFGEPSHGSWVGFPHYTWAANGDLHLPTESHNFGFLPHSPDVFLGGSGYGDDPDYVRRDKSDPAPILRKTWFFTASGKSRGWVRGAYLCDAPDQKGTWYLANDDSVVELNAALHPTIRRQFSIQGVPARPLKLFSDLRRGVFATASGVVVARW